MTSVNTSFPPLLKDWPLAINKKVYFDQGGDLYVSSIVTDKEVVADDELINFSLKYNRDFIINVLNNLAKQYDDEILEELETKVVLINHYIDPAPLTKEKILLGIPREEVESLEDLEEVEIENSIDVLFSINSFFDKIEIVSNMFVRYQKDYVRDLYRGSRIVYSGLDFQVESEKLFKFRKSLNDLIENNNVNVSDYERIEFSFDQEYKILRISLMSSILENKILLKQFSEYRESDPQDRGNTTFFIYNLANLEKDIKRSDFTFRDAIKSYFLNKPTISEPNVSAIKRTNNSGAAYGVDNSMVSKNISSMKEISNKSLSLLKDEVLMSVSSSPCMTPEDRKKLNERLSKDELKRRNFARQYSLAVQDTFFISLPDVLQKIMKKQGEAALQSLGKDFLNRLGLCGIGDLTSLAVNTVFSYLEPQEYSDELSKCALQNLKNENVSKLEAELIRLGKNTEVLERYRKFVGDTIPPWKAAGYTPPDYFKDLETDDPIIAQYTFKIPTAEEETDIDFRFSAYKDSIIASVDAQDTLNVLVNSFPDEMGWLNFFTDMTKSILDKCAAPRLVAQSGITSNWCDGRFQIPEIDDILSAVVSLTPKPSIIVGIIVEEAKNLIINLTVKLIIATMNQLFQIISAGISGDVNYFKNGDYIPDFFQKEDYLQNAIANSSGKSSNSRTNINNAINDVIKNMPSPSSGDISNDEINRFLQSSSKMLGEYEKIKLLKGLSGDTTFQKITELIQGGNFPAISQNLRNYGDIELFFLEMGKLIDISSLERAYFKGLQTIDGDIFCQKEDSSMLDLAYFNNKPEITQEQIDKMKETLKDIQKNKICYAVDMIGDPAGPMIGKISEILTDKNGPILGKVREQQAEFHNVVVDTIVNGLKELYYTDLFEVEGLLDMVLSVEGTSYNNALTAMNSLLVQARVLPDIISLPDGTDLLEQIRSNIGVFENWKPDLEGSIPNINPKLNKLYNVKLNYGSDNITLLENDGIIIKNNGNEVLNLKEQGKGITYAPSSQKIVDLLSENLGFLDLSTKNEIINKYMSNIYPDIVDGYYKDIKDQISGKGWFYLGWKKENGIYNGLKNNKDLIPLLLGAPKSSAKEFYKALDDPPQANLQKSKNIPFNDILTKSEIVQRYLYFDLIIRLIISEQCWKSTQLFETFSPDLFQEGDIISSYIYEKLIQNMEKYGFGSDKLKLSFFEGMTQIYLKGVESGIYEIKNNNTEESIGNINDQISSWINRSIPRNKEDFLENLQGDLENVAKDMIENIFQGCIKSFQLALRSLEGFREIPKFSTTKGYISEELQIRDVFNNVDDIGLDLESFVDLLGDSIEKYIKITSKDGTEIVENLQDFQKRIVESGASISQFYDSWKFGIRISSAGGSSSVGVGVDTFTEQQRENNKAFLLKNKDPERNIFLFPIIKFEKEIEDRVMSRSIIDEYDVSEMLEGLVSTDEFNNFYYKGMNIENLLSLNTIYTSESFSTFLEAGDYPSDVTRWKSRDFPDTSGRAFVNSKKFLFKAIKKEI